MPNQSSDGEDSALVEPLSCDLTVLSRDQRRRHSELTLFVLGKHLVINDLPNGYQFDFKNEPDTFLKIAEWIPLEKACCPFFSFSIEVEGRDDPVRLSVKGPPGSREIMRSALAETLPR